MTIEPVEQPPGRSRSTTTLLESKSGYLSPRRIYGVEPSRRRCFSQCRGRNLRFSWVTAGYLGRHLVHEGLSPGARVDMACHCLDSLCTRVR